ncbi:MAG: family N-acetyltransferase [Solirubrobacterales bacterium]|nr:family N-acetyltransferase [Solirubrobacterales bacterium]
MTSHLESTAALLGEVFPGARIADVAYLRWLYEASPYGGVIERNRLDELGTAAHYAVVPLELALDAAPVSGALSLNTAVHERARGGGAFVALAEETYALATERGVAVIVGVANANSTPGFERRLGFVNHGPLPATLLVPVPGPRSAVRSGWSSASPALLSELELVLAPPATGLTRRWTPEALRWRLASPGTRYALHRTDDALVVSTRETRSGVRVAIVLAAFAAAPLPAARTRALVRAVCRFHRAPLALHGGVNDRVAFRGPPLPERFRASPLNFITRSLTAERSVPAPARFEFLDFDAY